MYRTGQLGKGWPMTDTVQTRYRVTGMDCGSCAAKGDAAVRRLPGVADGSGSATAGIMMVHHAPEDTLLPALQANLKGLGYDVSPADGKAAQAPNSKSHDHDHAHSHDEPTDLHSHLHEHGAEEGPWWRTRKGLLTIASGIALTAAYGLGKLAPATERWAFLAAIAVGLVPIARRAFMAARAGTPFSIEMLMTIAAVGAVIIGATEEAATVVFLFLVGELLEGVAASRARKSIQDLTKLVPKSALLERKGGQVTEVPADSLAVGSVI